MINDIHLRSKTTIPTWPSNPITIEIPFEEMAQDESIGPLAKTTSIQWHFNLVHISEVDPMKNILSSPSKNEKKIDRDN